MGGEAAVFKHRPMSSKLVSDMHIYAQLNKNQSASDRQHEWRWMKMAFGENPKHSYGDGTTPATRMGSSWLMRAKFSAARKLMLEQDRWCHRGLDAIKEGSKFWCRWGGYCHHTVEDWLRYGAEPFPEDLSLESLVALLRGQVKLHAHVYEV